MAKQVIFLTRLLPDPVMERMETHFDLRYHCNDLHLDKDQIIKGLGKADGLISMLSDPIDREIIASASRLKIIANYAVGYNNIDLATTKEKGIVVTNTPGILTETTADLAWALMMAVARRIPEAAQSVHSKKWKGWTPTEFLGVDIYGKTLGMIGMGRIGQAFARRAHGFSMRLIYTSRTRQPEIEKALGLEFLSFEALLKQSDFLSLHLPLNETSRHLIDRNAFAMMKPTAILVNTSRGPIVDEKALVDALNIGKIAGAGLDVFENEPQITPELLEMKNVVALPHIGSATVKTRVNMGTMVLENLRAFFAKKRPPNMVN